MSIFNFVEKLLPRIERSTVQEDLRTTEKECINVAMPAWDAAATHFKINKLASDDALGMSQQFYRSFDMRRAAKSPNFIMDIARRTDAFHKNVVVLQGRIDELVERDIITDGLTMKNAFAIRAASNMSLVSRYLLALLNYIYTVEAEKHDVHLDPALEISKAELKYVENNFERFVKLYSEYTMPSDEFNTLLGSLPEVYINEKTKSAVTSMYGTNKMDPFEQYGVSGFVGNPIYRIRLKIAQWQNDRYESARAKKQQLELRLLYLQMQKDGNQDPTVANEIERLQGRIEGYDRYLREVEESIAEDK